MLKWATPVLHTCMTICHFGWCVEIIWNLWLRIYLHNNATLAFLKHWNKWTWKEGISCKRIFQPGTMKRNLHPVRGDQLCQNTEVDAFNLNENKLLFQVQGAFSVTFSHKSEQLLQMSTPDVFCCFWGALACSLFWNWSVRHLGLWRHIPLLKKATWQILIIAQHTWLPTYFCQTNGALQDMIELAIT